MVYTVPDRLLLKQDGLPIDMRDLDLELSLSDTVSLPTENIAVFRIISQAGLDAASPLAFTLPITRSKGIVYPERIARNGDRIQETITGARSGRCRKNRAALPHPCRATAAIP